MKPAVFYFHTVKEQMNLGNVHKANGVEFVLPFNFYLVAGGGRGGLLGGGLQRGILCRGV
jgi:hypothetical protein